MSRNSIESCNVRKVVTKSKVSRNSQLENEILFYRYLSDDLRAFTPGVINIDQTNIKLEIENLSSTYSFIDQVDGFDLDVSLRIVDSYFKMQAQITEEIYIEEVTLWPLNESIKSLAEDIRKWTNSEKEFWPDNGSFHTIIKKFTANLSPIYNDLTSNCKGLVHGDLRANNIACALHCNKIKFIDWESFGLGTILVDLAVFLVQSVKSKFQESTKRVILVRICRHYPQLDLAKAERLLLLTSLLVLIYPVRLRKHGCESNLYEKITKRMKHFYKNNLPQITYSLSYYS